MNGHVVERQVITFLVLVFVFSTICYVPIVAAGTLTTDGGIWLYALVWCPGIAGLLTRLVHQGNLRGIGWSWGGTRYQSLAYLLPIVAALIVYGLVWATGMGEFSSQSFTSVVAKELGIASISLPSGLIMAATVGLLLTTFPWALGEEIGWRGCLVPELAKSRSFATTAILSGVVWAVYHYPLILAANYHASTPRWFSLTSFTVTAVAASTIAAWLRLSSGSVWVATLFHASHNLFVQSVFDRLTVSRYQTEFLTTEFGAGLALTYALIAYWLVRRSWRVAPAITIAPPSRAAPADA